MKTRSFGEIKITTTTTRELTKIEEDPNIFTITQSYMAQLKAWKKAYKGTRENIKKLKTLVQGDTTNVSFTINGRKISIETTDELPELLHEIIIQNQYDISKEKVAGKTIIDCGANCGMFAILCVTLGAKRVYAFEPLPSTFATLKKNIEQSGMENIIIPINKATGSANTRMELSFGTENDVCASLSYMTKEKNHLTAEVVKIDDEIKEKTDLIKIDVEGYEEETLEGARQTIARDRPIITMSAYHKETDKTILPNKVKNICPDYTITLMKHAEEDFYCEANQ